MSSADSVVENIITNAQDNAMTKVAKRFSTPEQLRSIDKFRGEIQQKQANARAQLKAQLKTRISDASKSLELLDDSIKKVSGVRGAFQCVDEWCRAAERLIPEDAYRVIQTLCYTHTNITRTLAEIEYVKSVPKKIEEINELLKDDKGLRKSYSELRLLTDRREKAKKSFELSRLDQRIYLDAFNGLNETWTKFEEKLFRVFKNLIESSQKEPEVVVRAWEIVELEEKNDEKIRAVDPKSKQIKAYRRRAHQSVEQSIDAAFAVRLSAAVAEDAKTYMKNCNNFLDDLTSVLDDVTPCTPPYVEVLSLYGRRYHESFYRSFSALSGMNIAPQLIIDVSEWIVDCYAQSLERLGLVESPPLMGALEGLLKLYREKSKAIMTEWFERAFAEDLHTEPTLSDGSLMSHAPADVFAIAKSQLDIARATVNTTFIVQTANALIDSLCSFCDVERAYLDKEDAELKFCIAICNNNDLCIEKLEDLKDDLFESLDELYQGDVGFPAAVDAFAGVIEKAINTLTHFVIRDVRPAVGDFFSEDYMKDEDEARASVEQVLLCVKEYLIDEYKPNLPVNFVSRIATQTLVSLCELIAIQLITKSHKRMFNKENVDLFSEAIAKIKNTFSKFIKEQVVLKKIVILRDLFGILSADPDSTEMVVFSYGGLLKHFPDAPPAVVEYHKKLAFQLHHNYFKIEFAEEFRLLRLRNFINQRTSRFLLKERPDFPSEQLKDALERCEQQYQEQLAKEEKFTPTLFSRVKIPQSIIPMFK